MNLQEAYSTLELPTTATQDEAKKKYREFTKKYHPDINKEPDAEEKFKKINEAYHCIQTGKGTDREEQFNGNPFNMNPFEGFFNRQRTNQRHHQHIKVSTTISFEESVLGCKKDISFSRLVKCPECDGMGEQHISNGCTKCNGLGTITNQQGNMIFTQTCNKCGGRVKTKKCSKCNGSGSLSSDVSVQVQIPGGVLDGNVLRLGGMGNFVQNFLGMDQHTDAHLYISVTPSQNLHLEGNNVVTTIQISLLEAITGCTKSVETVLGMKDISVLPKSKNKDEVIIPKVGVDGVGSQRVILNVNYPDNIENLVKVLLN